jgi:hypothetical protein
MITFNFNFVAIFCLFTVLIRGEQIGISDRLLTTWSNKLLNEVFQDSKHIMLEMLTKENPAFGPFVDVSSAIDVHIPKLLYQLEDNRIEVVVVNTRITTDSEVLINGPLMFSHQDYVTLTIEVFLNFIISN